MPYRPCAPKDYAQARACRQGNSLRPPLNYFVAMQHEFNRNSEWGILGWIWEMTTQKCYVLRGQSDLS